MFSTKVDKRGSRLRQLRCDSSLSLHVKSLSTEVLLCQSPTEALNAPGSRKHFSLLQPVRCPFTHRMHVCRYNINAQKFMRVIRHSADYGQNWSAMCFLSLWTCSHASSCRVTGGSLLTVAPGTLGLGGHSIFMPEPCLISMLCTLQSYLVLELFTKNYNLAVYLTSPRPGFYSQHRPLALLMVQYHVGL